MIRKIFSTLIGKYLPYNFDILLTLTIIYAKSNKYLIKVRVKYVTNEFLKKNDTSVTVHRLTISQERIKSYCILKVFQPALRG